MVLLVVRTEVPQYWGDLSQTKLLCLLGLLSHAAPKGCQIKYHQSCTRSAY